MLQIERNLQTSEISLTINKKSSGLRSKELWIALTIAAGLHLAALILFRFPILNFKNLTIPTEVIVEADPPSNLQSGTRADWMPHRTLRLLPEHLLARRSSQPLAPSWEASSPFEGGNTHLAACPTLFRQLEKLDSINSLSPSSLPVPPNEVRIHVSGPLANYPHIYNDLNGISNLLPKHEAVYHFEVRVDPKCGRICWLNATDHDRNLKARHIAARLLTQLSFKLPSNIPLTAGQIEVIVANRLPQSEESDL